MDNWGKALRQSGHPKLAEQRLRQSIDFAKSLLDQLGAASSRAQQNVSALRPSISYARSQAELELGLLLASDSERRSLATDHFELAIAESSSLVEAFPHITMYRNLRDAAIRGRDEIRSTGGAKH
jgi:hypothetical protein